MVIKEEALKHWIELFYGYGSWEAKFWFVAYEEGGGDAPEEVADKINYFSSTYDPASHNLCNIRELYKQVAFKIDGPRADLFTSLFDYRFGKDAVQHGAWKNLIAFVHGYQNKLLPDLLNYQKKSLATVNDKNEALIRLFPLPAHNHAWYYSWLDLPQLPYLKSRRLYEDQVYPNRIDNILSKMIEYQPQVIVMYGMSNIDRLKKSVKAFYPGSKFTSAKAIKQHIPQHHQANLGATTLLVTTQRPQLRHGRIETGFDWEAFGKEVSQPKL